MARHLDSRVSSSSSSSRWDMAMVLVEAVDRVGIGVKVAGEVIIGGGER